MPLDVLMVLGTDRKPVPRVQKPFAIPSSLVVNLCSPINFHAASKVERFLGLLQANLTLRMLLKELLPQLSIGLTLAPSLIRNLGQRLASEQGFGAWL